MKRLFIVLIKYIPIIQMVGMLFNNILYCFSDIYIISYLLDGLLKAIEDKDGKVDIEGILSESIDNLVVAQVKKYPNVFSGVEIGGGTIKINIPSFDKQLVFDYNDIETFKQNILN